MSISTRKRAREEEILAVTTEKRAKNEEDNEDENTEVESSDLSEELLGNGDTEVFSTLIPLMRNVCILKTCRLVCKSWNQFACRALRKHSEVFCFVDEDFPDETETQLKLIVENVHLGLPSPFRIFKIAVGTLKEEHFLGFLKYLRETTSDFLLELGIYSYKVDQAELQTVLTCNQNNLKIIKLTLDGETIDQDGDGGNANVIQPELIRLPYLKTFQILNYSLMDDQLVSLCENICRYSPLQSVTIKSHGLGDELKKVMSSLSTKCVEELCLDFSERLSLDDWEFIRARLFQIQGIKKLSIYHPNSTHLGASYYDNFEAIISYFAGSLESLAGDYLPRFNEKGFPELREIKDTPFDFEFYYPVDRYPLLSKTTFVVGSNDMFRDITDEPNLAIQQLSFESVTNPESFFKVISLARWRFPNVSNFAVDYSDEIQFTSEMLGVICESFPKLTCLELRVNLEDDKTLSGLRENFVEWLYEGWPLERIIPRAPSLLNFLELEKLTLGPSVLVTENLFSYCLSKIPKLQYLTFYLNGEVSAADVRDSVGHLTRIKVVVLESINPREELVEEMERLRVMLPTVVEIKKYS